MALFDLRVYHWDLQRKTKISIKDHLSIKNYRSRKACLYWENCRSWTTNHRLSRNLKGSLKAYLHLKDCWGTDLCWKKSTKVMC